jgi:hypothetical protein
MGRGLLSQALESALRLAGLDHSCERCGGLRRGAPSVLNIGERLVPQVCEGCGLPLDDEGRARGSRGRDGRIRWPVLNRFEGPRPAPLKPPRA